MQTDHIYEAIQSERKRQNEKFRELHQGGYGVHVPGSMLDSERLAILTEEVGEVARAINDEEGDRGIKRELIQVAAVAVAWLEAL